MSLLAIDSLCFARRRVTILDGVSLAVAPGEVVALLGRNGAGKSTLLQCVLGVLPPSSGRVTIGGDDIASLSRPELARRMAYVPQAAGSVLALSVAEMVMLGRAPHRAISTRAEDRRIVAESLERLDLDSLALRPFARLSGGEKRRVMLARAIAQRAPLLLLDEPTSDLDPGHQLDIMNLVRTLAERKGVAVLMAIHDLSLAARFADRLALLRAGRIHEDGPPKEVLTPATLRAVYDVETLVGASDGLPFVLPRTRLREVPQPDDRSRS